MRVVPAFREWVVELFVGGARTMNWKDLIAADEYDDVEALMKEYADKFSPTRARELSLVDTNMKLFPPPGRYGPMGEFVPSS